MPRSSTPFQRSSLPSSVISSSSSWLSPLRSMLEGHFTLPFKAVLQTGPTTLSNFPSSDTHSLRDRCTHPAMKFLRLLNPFPSPANATSQKIERLNEKQIPTFPLLPTSSILSSSSVNVIVHHNDSGFGSMSRSTHSSMMSFTSHVSLSLWLLNIQ